MDKPDLTQIQLTWCLDILTRIKKLLESPGWTDEQKLVSVEWLVKQALKGQTEE